jgi:ABC-type glycerol-3-phosphate transport system permease component
MAGNSFAVRTAEHRTARSSAAQARYLLGRFGLHAVALVLTVVLMGPFVWAILSSLKPDTEIKQLPPVLWPSTFVWYNYVEVWTTKLFAIWTRNTLIITLLATSGTVLTAALGGYAFARFRFPGRSLLFGLTISTMMLPETVTLIPRFILYYQLGWLNTYLPLIVPFWFGGGAFFIFLFRQFFMTIPIDLDEAAKIDGANYLQILFRIVLPLSLPVLATCAIIAFVSHWDSFLFPLLVLNDPEKFTVSIGLRWFSISPSADARPTDHLLLAGSIMMTIPIVLLFFFGQRYFVRGVVMSGIKG